jgi:hypothetical protein
MPTKHIVKLRMMQPIFLVPRFPSKSGLIHKHISLLGLAKRALREMVCTGTVLELEHRWNRCPWNVMTHHPVCASSFLPNTSYAKLPWSKTTSPSTRCARRPAARPQAECDECGSRGDTMRQKIGFAGDRPVEYIEETKWSRPSRPSKRVSLLFERDKLSPRSLSCKEVALSRSCPVRIAQRS